MGPTDPVTGTIVGGNRMLLFNFELIFLILKNAGMKGVVFFDTGNAWNNEYNLGDMRKTAGAGIRWYSRRAAAPRGATSWTPSRGGGLPLGLHDGGGRCKRPPPRI